VLFRSLSAIEASCERVFGTGSLRGRSVAVVGLGHVGRARARRLDRAGARLFVTDIDRAKHPLARELGARWIAPATALSTPVDVIAPCALGGVLDDESIAALQAPAVCGAANNQLASPAAAARLQERGILWAPDFIVNAGGIINISVELEPDGYDPARARARTRAIGDTIRRVFDDAKADGATPLDAAMALARANLSAGS
jgi:leucine dehydrogenase